MVDKLLKRTLMSNNQDKPKTLRRYVLKVQSIVALVVVLSYTVVVHFYFMNGLDEANFQDLHLETNHFAKAYRIDPTIQLPNSIHFTGYLDWLQLPLTIQEEFPSLKTLTQVEMTNIRKWDREQFIPWPKQVIFVVGHPLNDGKVLYLVRNIDTEQYDALSKIGIVKMFSLTWPLALLFLILMQLVVHLVLKRTLRPFNQLSDWVDTLSLENAKQVLPDFEFKELNKIAEQQQKSLIRISDVLDKEQDFLRHASHELRTPIAVVKSNSELLVRILDSSENIPKGLVAVGRIKRAALNMQHMTETLLWLSREDNEEIASSEVSIKEMIEFLVEDNQYLLQSKAVEVELCLDDNSLNIAETPCRLVLNNLIRNAFQYTAEGEVIISFEQNKVKITNVNKSEDAIDHTGADYGYGLGLRLVDKIVKKMHWQYQNNDIAGGRSVEVGFDSLSIEYN